MIFKVLDDEIDEIEINTLEELETLCNFYEFPMIMDFERKTLQPFDYMDWI